MYCKQLLWTDLQRATLGNVNNYNRHGCTREEFSILWTLQGATSDCKHKTNKANPLITPFESDLRWPLQNTFIISLVSDHNLLVDDRFIKKKVPNMRPFEKY